METLRPINIKRARQLTQTTLFSHIKVRRSKICKVTNYVHIQRKCCHIPIKVKFRKVSNEIYIYHVNIMLK